MSTEGAPPRELVVDARPPPGDASDGSGSAMGPIAVPVLVAALLAKFFSPAAGLVALGAGVGAFLVKRKPDRGRFVLRVEEGRVLEVSRERGREPAERMALDDLLDVSLDKQTNQAGGRGPTERVRILLEHRAGDERRSTFVPDTRLTPLEAQEWQGKVRVFLRKHGWLPEDER